MHIDSKVSERINYLRFIMIVGVVFIHSHTNIRDYIQHNTIENSLTTYNFIHILISQILARIAVPFFFITSAYLLYCKIISDEGNLLQTEFVLNLKRKIKSLFVPFILWNLLSLFLFFILEFYFSLDDLQYYFFPFLEKRIADYSLWDHAKHLLGIQNFPFVYQFWFIRDLIKLILLSPVLYLYAKKVPKITALCLYFLWMLQVPSMPVFYSMEIVFFYFIGICLVVHKVNLHLLDDTCIILPYILIAIGIALFLTLKVTPYHTYYILTRITILLGIPVVWKLAGILPHIVKTKLHQLSGYYFFVYAAHEPMLYGIRKIIFYYLRPTTEWELILYYFAFTAFVVCVCLVLAKHLHKYLPTPYHLLTGTRSHRLNKA